MNFFVYLHRRASNGKVFYVGKGTRYRHKSKWNRTQHWHNIVNKHGYTVEIVQHGMQEWWAFELEKDLILKYKDHGLCNRTDGGEGASGCVASKETKAKFKQQRWSEKWRTNLSNKAKIRFANPEYRQKHAATLKTLMSRPEVKQRLRESANKQFSDPAARELARQKTLAQFANPQAIAHAKLKALERFNTPEKRALHVQAKAVRCMDNGMVFGTTTLAAEWVTSWRGAKADNSQIAKACRGTIPSAYKLRWEYLKPATEVVDSLWAD